MSCKKEWNYETMMQLFPKSFVTTSLKEHRRNQLFERELSLMPATQPYVEREVQVRNLRQHNAQCTLDVKKLKVRYQELVMEHGNRRVPEKALIKEQINELYVDIHEANMELNRLLYSNHTIAAVKQPKITRHCPANDCRGFLNTKWECGVCNSKACSECHELLDPNNREHKCKPEDVETAKMLMQDSKPCPGCAVLIFKISGCNQMWCSNCGTTFDWTTLRIDRGHIHNPEYFRALHAGHLPFANRANNNADVCGNNMPPDYQVVSHINSIKNLPQISRTVLIEFYRKIRHYDQVFRARYRYNIIEENRDLRIKYMLKDIDADILKRRLQLREKATNKCTAIMQVLDMVIAMGTGLFHDLILNNQVKFMETKITEFEQLTQYGQKCLDNVSRTYDCEVPKL